MVEENSYIDGAIDFSDEPDDNKIEDVSDCEVYIGKDDTEWKRPPYIRAQPSQTKHIRGSTKKTKLSLEKHIDVFSLFFDNENQVRAFIG